jgi:nuclear pore complex protein Nup98-Nup96
MFGQPLNQTTTQPATTGFGSGSLFGAKPATTGTSLFGQPNNQQQSGNGLGGSMFGNTLGGGTSNLGTSSLGLGNSMAGSMAGGQTGQAPLTASVAQPVSTNIPIFSLLPNPPGPLSSTDASPPKRASSFFVDVPTRSPVVGLTGSRNTGVNKLRGFGSSTYGLAQSSYGGASTNRGFSSSTMTLASSQSPAKGGLGDSRGLLGPQSFLSGNGEGRQSPKKLILDKKIDPNEVFGKSSSSQKGAKVAFNPAMSFAAREKEAQNFGGGPGTTSTPSASPKKTSVPLGSAEKGSPSKSKETSGGKANELKEGDYWLKPSLEELRKMSNSELSTFKGLTVGRVGFGEITFLEPVDLTSLPRLSALLGKVVQIDKKECAVYPDSVEGDDVKPPPGEGLNVPARIVLSGCWPVDRATREPIKEEQHPLFVKHLKRLKSMKRTHFENYSIEDGKWTFRVDHF